jgi:hypothetical protein
MAKKFHTLFEELKTLIVKPVEFFTTILPKKTFKQAVLFSLVLSYISFLPLVLIYSTIFSFAIQEFIPVPFYVIIIAAVTLLPLAGLLCSFVSSFFSYIVLKIFKGKGTYVDTYKVGAYAGFPGAIGMFLFMFGGGLLSIYSCVLQVIGYAKTHKVSYWKGAAPLITSVVFSIIAMIVFFAFAFSSFSVGPNAIISNANATQKIDADFDQLFTGFQTINNRFVTLSSLDYTIISEVDNAKTHLDVIDKEIKSAKETMASMNGTVTLLENKKLSDSSDKQLIELREVLRLYSDSLDNLEKASKGYDDFIELSDYQAQITFKLDKFLSIDGLAEEYIDDGKYDLALEQLRKAIVINEDMLDVRKAQHALFSEKFTIVDRLLKEDEAYEEFILQKEKDLEALTKNPNIAASERFKKSDALYETYNNIYVEPNDAASYMGSWIDNNIGIYLQKSDDILTSADIKYNSLMENFYIY